MRLLLATCQVPFISGGAETLTANLQDQLREAGHEVDTVTLPFKWYPPETLQESMVAARLLDLEHYSGLPVDRVIGLRFPMWLARHPDKVFWIIHQFRAAYDQWTNDTGFLANYDNGNTIRQAVWNADKEEFASAKFVGTISKLVSARLNRYLKLPSTPIYHPPPLAGRLQQGGYGDYFYFPSRVVGDKRQSMVIEALAKVKEPVKVIFSGAANDPAYLDELKAKARALDVEQKIEWRGRVELDEMIRLYAEAKAVVFPPIDEDYGYITLEAMLAGKAVITTDDSGGVLEFVEHDRTGWVTQATPDALALAMDEAWADPVGVEARGKAAYAAYQSLNISWENVVRALTR